MLILLFLSGYFYLEKIALFDSAYLTVEMINSKGFMVVHGRYPLILTQLLPVLLINLNAPISYVLFSYAINFYLLYLGCFLLASLWFKQPQIALIIPLVCSINSAHVFFIQTEVLHGLVFCVTFWAWLKQHKPVQANTLTQAIVGILCFACAVLFHPVANLMVMFLLGLEIINNAKHKPLYGWLVIATIWFLIKPSLPNTGGYENQFYSQKTTLTDTIFNLTESTVIRFYVGHFNHLYYLCTTLFAASVGVLFWKKKHLLVLFFILSWIGYLLVMAVTFKGDSQAMMERVYLALALIACVAMLMALEELSFKKNWTLALILVLFGNGLWFILKASKSPTKHLKEELSLAASLQKKEGNKFYGFNKDISFAYDFSLWPLAAEQLLLSAIYYPNQIKTVYIFEDEKTATEVINNQVNEHTILLAPFYLVTQTTAYNPNYFSLKPNLYQKLNNN